MWALFRFGVKCASGIRHELALVPLLSFAEVKCAGQDYNRPRRIRMPMRHTLQTGRDLGACDEHPRFCRVAVQHGGLQSPCQRTLELDILGEFEDTCVRTLRISRCRHTNCAEY